MGKEISLAYKLGVARRFCQLMMLARESTINRIAFKHNKPPAEIIINHFQEGYTIASHPVKCY